MTTVVGGAARLHRDLHPVAWWCWAIGLAVAASMTTNPLTLLLLIGVAAVVVALRRSSQPWGSSFRLYLVLGAIIVAIRVVFRIIFGGDALGRVLIDLPSIPLPDWALGISLFGPITRESLLAGCYDGLRLAAIVICVGAANSLANPKRLLRSMPAGLYEIGTALVVAVSVLPQLVDSARRVRAAQALRGGVVSRTGRLRRFLVPVLEDALERSLALAAGMDTRGYGRSAGQTRAQHRITGALMLSGLCGICAGSYALLDRDAPAWLSWPMLGIGVTVAVFGLLSAGRRVTRSRYRPDPWRWPEFVVVGGGVVVAAVGIVLAYREIPYAYPGLDEWPQVHLLALAAIALALLAALCSPSPQQPVVSRLGAGAPRTSTYGGGPGPLVEVRGKRGSKSGLWGERSELGSRLGAGAPRTSTDGGGPGPLVDVRGKRGSKPGLWGERSALGSGRGAGVPRTSTDGGDA